MKARSGLLLLLLLPGRVTQAGHSMQATAHHTIAKCFW